MENSRNSLVIENWEKVKPNVKNITVASLLESCFVACALFHFYGSVSNG